MKRAKAFKNLTVLLLLSLVILLANFILKKVSPELFLEAHRENPVELAMAKYRLMDDLPLEKNVAEIAQKNERGILTWPQASIIPEYHKVDLSIFRKRPRNVHALEGITVYLDAGELLKALDLAEVSRQKYEEESRKASNVAATDPVTGLPVSDYGWKVEEEPQEVITEIRSIPKDQLLATLANQLKDELEKLGAKVYLMRELTDSPSEISQAGVLGSKLASAFVEELREQKFKSPEIENLIPYLYKAAKDPDSPEARRIFTDLGVGPELRLLLDLEKQYQDVCFISLRLGDAPEGSGTRVRYYGGSVAAANGAAALLEDRPQDQPAYVAYTGTSRRRFAETIMANIKRSLPEMSYKGKYSEVSEGDFPGAALNNLSSVEVILAEIENEENMLFISQENKLRLMAEALASATYQFYCGD